MSEPNPVLTPDRPGEPLVYRPLSGLAVAGFGFAVAYAVLVVVGGLVALVNGDPFLMGMGTFVIPVAGAVLCFAAQWQIRNAEGTRAGTALARWGWWLSLLLGLGYLAYFGATRFAVSRQAADFLLAGYTPPGETARAPRDKEVPGVFARLIAAGELLKQIEAAPNEEKRAELVKRRQVEINQAFLMSQPLSRRGGVNPNDEAAMERVFNGAAQGSPKGFLSLFRDNPLVRMIQQGGKDTLIESLGVHSWSYENRGYRVDTTYRITTPEATVEIIASTQSHDLPREGRQWYMDLSRSGPTNPIEQTPRGQTLSRLRQDARKFAEAWVADYNRHKVDEKSLSGKFPNTRNLVDLLSKDGREKFKENLKQLFDPSDKDRPLLRPRFDDQVGSTWTVLDGGVLRIELDCMFPVTQHEGSHTPLHYVEGKLVVERKNPADALSTGSTAKWQVVRLDLLRAKETPKLPPPGAAQRG
jgi:hypothetical protein